MVAYYGEARGVVLFRKHLSRYLDHLALGDAERQALLTASAVSELVALLGTRRELGRPPRPKAAFHTAAIGA
jgi:hypothetical protein